MILPLVDAPRLLDVLAHSRKRAAVVRAICDRLGEADDITLARYVLAGRVNNWTPGMGGGSGVASRKAASIDRVRPWRAMVKPAPRRAAIRGLVRDERSLESCSTRSMMTTPTFAHSSTTDGKSPAVPYVVDDWIEALLDLPREQRPWGNVARRCRSSDRLAVKKPS